jgi:hypothetical protein
VQILDNNEATVTITPGQTFLVNNNALAKFKPQSLYNGTDYVNLSGSLNIGAPGVNDLFLKMKYTKPGSNVQMAFEKVVLDFAPSGKVHFEAKEYNIPNIRITPDILEIDGFVAEKATPSFNPMPVVLIAYPNTPPSGKKKYNIDISNRVDPNNKKWTTQLSQTTNADADLFAVKSSSAGARLQDIEGGMYVEGNNWTKLVYSGTLYDNAHTDGIKNPKMTFTVFGDVSANSDGVDFSGLQVGFGELNAKYEYSKHRFAGDIKVTPGMPFGPAIIKQGSVGFMFGKEGFYLAGGMDTYVALPFIQGVYQMGFMLGYYEGKEKLEKIWNDYVMKYKSNLLENTCYLPKIINYKLAGFYFGLDRVLLDVNESYGMCGIGFDLKAYAGVGFDFYTNFSPFAIGLSGRARVKIHAEFDAVLAKVDANLDAFGAFNCTVNGPKSFDVDALLGMNVRLKVEGCAPIFGCETLFHEDIQCSANAHSQNANITNFSFKIGSGGFKIECPKYDQK